MLVKALKSLIAWVLAAVGTFYTLSFAANFLGTTKLEKRPAQAPLTSDQLIEGLATRLQHLAEKYQWQGLAVIAEKEQVLWQKSYGQRGFFASEGFDLQTPFRINSLSKQFVAAAMLKLQEQGRLSLQDTVCKHLRNFCGLEFRNITIRHLLSHTAGFAETENLLWRAVQVMAWSYLPLGLTTSERWLSLGQGINSPGKEFRYSNYGYLVASRVIEAVAHQEFSQAMEEILFIPNGLKGSTFRAEFINRGSRLVAPGRWVVDFWGSAVFFPADFLQQLSRGNTAGAGGAVSTARDLVQWMQILRTDSYLGPSSRRQLFVVEKDSYALGWVVETGGPHGRESRWHSRWHNGASSGHYVLLWEEPGSQRAVVLLSNVDHLGGMREKLMAQILRWLTGRENGWPEDMKKDTQI